MLDTYVYLAMDTPGQCPSKNFWNTKLFVLEEKMFLQVVILINYVPHTYKHVT